MVNPTKSLYDSGLKLDQFMTDGSEVFFNATLVDASVGLPVNTAVGSFEILLYS